MKDVEHAARKTKNLWQEYVELNQLNEKTHNDLNHLQVDLEQMTQDYAKMEESNLEQQGIIIDLEQSYQDFKKQQVVVHIEFDREKQSLIVQIQD